MSNIRIDNIAPSAGGTYRNAPRGIAAAWVNFTGVATTAIRDSVNVSSLTDNETGSTTITLTNNMGNINYTGSWYTNASYLLPAANFDNHYVGGFGDRTTSSYGVWCYNGTASVDSAYNDSIIHGDLA